MNQTVTKLWNRDFITYIIGMELSLISDNLLRFALPLYILIYTGNPAIMGVVLSTFNIPYIILSSVGGVMADRISKRRILAIMNLISGCIIIPYLILMQLLHVVPLTIVLFFVLAIIGSLMSPSSEASMPLIVPEEQLSRAFSLSFLLTILSSVGVPVVGGWIMTRFGVTPIIVLCIVFYIMAALVNAITKIPHTVQPMEYGAFKTAWFDIKEAGLYLLHENRFLAKIIIILFLVNAILNAIVSTAIPVLAFAYLGKSESITGILTGAIIFGATVGVILLQLIGEERTIKFMRSIILTASVLLLSTGIVFVLGSNEVFLLIYMIATFFFIFALTSILETVAFTLVGKLTKERLLGKVMAIMVSFMVLGYVVGDLVYGFLFRIFLVQGRPGVVLIIMASAGVVVAGFAKIQHEKV